MTEPMRTTMMDAIHSAKPLSVRPSIRICTEPAARTVLDASSVIAHCVELLEAGGMASIQTARKYHAPRAVAVAAAPC